MSWESFIERQYGLEDHEIRAYDKLLELAVSSYELETKNRRIEYIDMRHFVINWWIKNRIRFKRYNNYEKIGELLKMDHSSVSYYLNRRKKSLLYDYNTESLRDFLES